MKNSELLAEVLKDNADKPIIFYSNDKVVDNNTFNDYVIRKCCIETILYSDYWLYEKNMLFTKVSFRKFVEETWGIDIDIEAYLSQYKDRWKDCIVVYLE